MFLDLLQMVLHAHNQVLQVSLVGFGTHGVHLTTDFLANEPKFLALTWLVAFQGLKEIVQVVLQAYLLLGDIEFLDVVNQLLFKAVFVIIHLFEFSE